MKKHTPFALVAFLVAATGGHAAPALVDDAAGSQACFTRSYDAAHLAKNPTQKTVSMRFALRRETYPGSVNTPLQTFAGWRSCGVTTRGRGGLSGNARSSRKQTAPTAARSSQAILVRMASPRHMTGENLDAEGGIFMIEAAGDRLKVYFDDDITMRTDARVTDGPGKYIAFGPADRIFILNRAAGDVCSDLQKAIKVE